jgi:hypothetical protein
MFGYWETVTASLNVIRGLSVKNLTLNALKKGFRGKGENAKRRDGGNNPRNYIYWVEIIQRYRPDILETWNADRHEFDRDQGLIIWTDFGGSQEIWQGAIEIAVCHFSRVGPMAGDTAHGGVLGGSCG